jgi:hypothetical protein
MAIDHVLSRAREWVKSQYFYGFFLRAIDWPLRERESCGWSGMIYFLPGSDPGCNFLALVSFLVDLKLSLELGVI